MIFVSFLPHLRGRMIPRRCGLLQATVDATLAEEQDAAGAPSPDGVTR
ncbi:hypothetical protein HDC37_003007 [Microbacterium sp. AK009]|nr:hypothetical protein [Microbacterium sp. AK009]NYF18151.1 hypothetical protein [Microbacterium sp. AK009]